MISKISSDQSDNSNTVGLVLAIVGTFLFALKSIFIKLAYAEGATTDEVLLLRMLMAAPFYVAMLVYLHKFASRETSTGSPRASLKWLSILKISGSGFLGYYLASYLDLAGLNYISAQLERLTLFTYPTIIAILAALFLGEKFTKKTLASLVLCYLGLWIMYNEEQLLANTPDTKLGVLLVLGSALSYSCYVILAKPMIQKFGSRLFTCIAMLGSSIFVCIHYFSQHSSSLAHITPLIWIYSAILAFICTVIPSFMITEAISRIGAAKTSILGSAGPVFTIFLAVLILDEPFTLWHALGVAIVLTGVGIISKRKKRKIPSP